MSERIKIRKLDGHKESKVKPFLNEIIKYNLLTELIYLNRKYFFLGKKIIKKRQQNYVQLGKDETRKLITNYSVI